MKRYLLLAAITVTVVTAGASFTTAAPGARQDKDEEKHVRMKDLPAAVQKVVDALACAAVVAGESGQQ